MAMDWLNNLTITKVDEAARVLGMGPHDLLESILRPFCDDEYVHPDSLT